MLIKNFTDDKFIRAYNSFSNSDSIFFLNDEEFYIYSILFTNQMSDGCIRTSVDILNQINLPVRFIVEDTKNKGKIKSLISSLINKKVLILENEVEKISNNTMLELSINDIELSNDGLTDDKKISDPTKFKNFAKIPFSKFIRFKSTKDYYIYYTVSRWSNGFNYSYGQWADLLGYKHQESALRVINDAVDRGVIYKNIGDYNSKTKQDANVYSITPFAEEKKTKQTKITEQKQVNMGVKDKLNEIEHDDGYVKDINDAIYFFSNRVDEDGSNLYPDSTHYELFMEVQDNIKDRHPSDLEKLLVMKAKKRINELKNNFGFTKEWEEAKQSYKKRKQDKILEQLETATNAIKMKDDSIVIVDESNIDLIDWKEVYSFYYGDGQLKYDISTLTFQPAENGTYLHRPDMLEYGWQLYKEHVKAGKMLTYSSREQMQCKVFEEKFSFNNEEHNGFYDYSVAAMEISSSKKNDDRDISKFLDPEEVF